MATLKRWKITEVTLLLLRHLTVLESAETKLKLEHQLTRDKFENGT